MIKIVGNSKIYVDNLVMSINGGISKIKYNNIMVFLEIICYK